ncbi:unnamed protein product [Eretmochelys imbricata]
MIVNEKAPLSRAMFWELKRLAPEGVPVYQQEILEPDVWQILDGDKDDFFIYDRCGRLAFHIPLPYSFLHFRYVESAVRFTYAKDVCGNCSLYSNSTQEANGTAEGPKSLSQPPELEEKEQELAPHESKAHPELEEKEQELAPHESKAHRPHHHRASSNSDPQASSPTHSHHQEPPQGQQPEVPAPKEEEEGDVA